MTNPGHELRHYLTWRRTRKRYELVFALHRKRRAELEKLAAQESWQESDERDRFRRCRLELATQQFEKERAELEKSLTQQQLARSLEKMALPQQLLGGRRMRRVVELSDQLEKVSAEWKKSQLTERLTTQFERQHAKLALPQDLLSWAERHELELARQFVLEKSATQLAIQLEAELPRKFPFSDSVVPEIALKLVPFIVSRKLRDGVMGDLTEDFRDDAVWGRPYALAHLWWELAGLCIRRFGPTAIVMGIGAWFRQKLGL